MKTIFSIMIFCFCVISANSQTTETISKLTPYTVKALSFKQFARTFPKSEYGDIEFDVKAETVILPNQTKGVAIIIKAKIEELVYQNIGGKEIARIRIYGRITSKDKTTDGYFWENVKDVRSEEDIRNYRGKSFNLRKVFRLEKGKYKIGIIFQDTLDRGKKVIKFQVT